MRKESVNIKKQKQKTELGDLEVLILPLTQ